MSRVAFAPSAPSVLSVFTSGVTPSTRVDYQVSQNSAAVIPVQNLDYTSRGQRIAMYPLLNVGAPYELDLVYRFYSGKCPAYALQINLKTIEELSRELACPTSQNPTFPSISIDNEGFSSEVVSSFIPAATVLSRNNSFIRELPLELTRPSFVSLALEFNSMAAPLNISVFQRVAVGNVSVLNHIADGIWQGQTQHSGTTTLTNTYYAQLSGSYVIRINSPPYFASSPLGSSPLCFPYIWSSSVIPVGRAYVATVFLSDAVGLNPSLALSVTLTFSSAAYASSGLVVKSANSQVVVSAFYLSGNDGSSVSPTSATGISDDHRIWKLTFAAGALRGSTTYTLRTPTPAVLYGDSARTQPLYLPATHVYTTIDTTCSNRGTWDAANGVCQCLGPYAGIDCSVCATNFTYSEGSCIAEECTINTCNCDPNIQGWCSPLGVCTETPEGARCKCSAAYEDQTYCRSCSPGYSGYPDCQRYIECNPACENGGTCDTEVGQCKCPQNFAGDHCQSCATDYSGDKCQDYQAGSDSWKTTRTFLGITAAILVVAGAAVAAVWYIRRRGFGGKYRTLPRFDDDDEEAAPLPSYNNQFDEEGSEGHSALARFDTDRLSAALGGPDSDHPANEQAGPSTSSPSQPTNNNNTTTTTSSAPSIVDANAFSINGDDGDAPPPNPRGSLLDM